MTLGFSEERRRRRRQRPWTILKWMIILASIAAAGWYGYQLGSGLMRAELLQLRDEVDRLATERGDFDKMRAEMRGALAIEQAKVAECQERYDRDVPSADLLEINRLMRDKEAKGITLERLRQVIASASLHQTCDRPFKPQSLAVSVNAEQPGTPTPLANEKRFKLRASGSPKSPAGRKPVFDPQQPVTIVISREEAPDTEVSGTLPLSSAIVFQGFEYRFTFTASRQGTVTVGVQRCQFP